MAITPWLCVRARFIGKEGHNVYKPHQFDQSMPVFRDHIRANCGCIAVVPDFRRDDGVHSHVHPHAGGADYDAGGDARWLFEGRLGHTRSASPWAALVVAGAAGTT